MAGERLFAITFFLILNSGAIVSELAKDSICECDVSFSSRAHIKVSSRSVVFSDALTKGEEYRRPLGASSSLDKQLNGLHSRNLKNPKDDDNDILGDLETCGSEQIHITLGEYSDSVVVSYTSFVFNTSTTVEYADSVNDILGAKKSVKIATSSAFSFSNKLFIAHRLIEPSIGAQPATEEEVLAKQNTFSWAFDKETGERFSNYFNYSEVQYGDSDYNNPYNYYDSPLLYTAVLVGLESGVIYYYRVGGSCSVYSFKMPHIQQNSENGSYPFIVGLTADVGQTNVSAATFAALRSLDPAVVLLAGDLSYADGWISRWDSFGRAIEPLAASIPLLTTGGNHEVGSGENWMSYYWRYPTPYRASRTPSPNPCFWGREVGVMTAISLCSYAGFTNNSLQYQWLSKFLANNIDRTRTPWLVVLLHVPFYSSSNGHWREGELMRRAMEPLLYQHGVDIILAGHVHSYERTAPLYDNAIDECGPVYLNLGDGGNYEGTYNEWRRPRPEWSAFREASFGVGQLEFVNTTHALYGWHRHACGSDVPGDEGVDFSDECVTPGDNSSFRMLTSDVAWIVRPGVSNCPARHLSSFTGCSLSTSADKAIDFGGNTDTPDKEEKSASSGDGYNSLLTALSVLLILSVIANVYMVFVVYVVKEKCTSGSMCSSCLFAAGTGTDTGAGRVQVRTLLAGRAANGILGGMDHYLGNCGAARRGSSFDDSTHSDAGMIISAIHADGGDHTHDHHRGEHQQPVLHRGGVRPINDSTIQAAVLSTEV